MDAELLYLLLICTLLIVPRALQRARIPAPLTCLLIGLIAVQFLPKVDSGLVHFAAVLGIASLFLHAGLEVDFARLRLQAPALLVYAGVRLLALAAVAWLASRFLALAWQPALLFALALLTSSTGFILDSLDRFRLDEHERLAIANEAITGELLSLALMFVVLQSGDGMQFALSAGSLVSLVVVIPVLYVVLSRWVAPHAPGSEFSLLVGVAIAAAFVTDKLGVEYLLGAFIAGLIATSMRGYAPEALAHGTMHAVKLFSSFFMPFYFFRNGVEIPLGALSPAAAGVGLLLCLLIPLRFGAAWLRRKARGDAGESAKQIAVSLLPTLIFTLVLAHILKDRYAISDALLGGLLLYAVVNTLLPSFLLRVGIEPAEPRA